MKHIPERLAGTDIYLLDQLLRGRITPEMRILDAGCGSGRNLGWFLSGGWEVYGMDADAAAIAATRRRANELAPKLSADNFRHETIEANTFADEIADLVISCAVLHFARDGAHFDALLNGSWRTLRPGGLFFCRLASSIGLEDALQPRGGRRFGLPDGSDRYLVDAPLLRAKARELGGTHLDPIKTTVVDGQRAMTTWVLRKDG